MRHDLIHSIREKCAHQEVLYGRLKQAGRARGLKLLPCAIVESSQFRLRLVVEGQRGRAFQLDFFAPIVFDNPRLEAQTIRAWRGCWPDEQIVVNRVYPRQPEAPPIDFLHRRPSFPWSQKKEEKRSFNGGRSEEHTAELKSLLRNS